MDVDDDAEAVHRLISTAHQAPYTPSEASWRQALQRVHARWSRRGQPAQEVPWRDTLSQNRPGWRERAA